MQIVYIIIWLPYQILRGPGKVSSGTLLQWSEYWTLYWAFRQADCLGSMMGTRLQAQQQAQADETRPTCHSPSGTLLLPDLLWRIEGSRLLTMSHLIQLLLLGLSLSLSLVGLASALSDKVRLPRDFGNALFFSAEPLMTAWPMVTHRVSYTWMI